MIRTLPVPDALVGSRCDAALARMLGLSRTQAAALVSDGAVCVNGRTVTKADTLPPAAWIEVDLPEPATPFDEQVHEPVPGMDVVYDDAHLVIVNKPEGVAAHASVGWTGPTVLGGLMAAGYRITTSGAAERRGIVSRLDVGTSGLMVVAKSEAAYSGLKRMFRDREPIKVYHAVCQGHPEPTSGTIDAPIGRSPSAEWKFAVTHGGRESITHYDVVEMLPSASLLQIHLETGRTHQIRVHFQAIRHPLVGDLVYGADPVVASRLRLERQWLHSQRLAFTHPVTGEWIDVTCEYPADLDRALAMLREQYGN